MVGCSDIGTRKLFSASLIFLLGFELFGLPLVLGDPAGLLVLTTYLYKLTNLLGVPSYHLMAVVALSIVALTFPLVTLYTGITEIPLLPFGSLLQMSLARDVTLTLVALACGYYVGGQLADRSQQLGRLYWAILGAAIPERKSEIEQGFAGLAHLLRRGFKAEVKQMALTPDGPGPRRLAVHAAADDFQLGRLFMLIRVGAPTGRLRSVAVADKRQYFDRGSVSC